MIKDKKQNIPRAILDFNLRLLQTNTSFQDFFQNQGKVDVNANKITNLFEFEDLNKFKQAIGEINKGTKDEDVFFVKRKNKAYVETIVVTITRHNDSQQKWSNAVVNLTCEKAKDFSSDFFTPNFVLQNSPLQVFVVNIDYKLVYFNQKAATFIRDVFQQDLALGERVFFGEESEDEWRNYFDVVMQGGDLILEKNYQIDSKEYYNLITLVPMKNEGVVEGCIFYGKDILDLKKVEEALFGREQENKHLFENNLLGIGLLDENLEFTTVNESFYRLTSFRKNELTRFKIEDLIDESKRSWFDEQILEINEHKISEFTSDLDFSLNQKEVRHLHLEVKGLFDDKKNTGYILTIFDVTQQQKAQQKEQEIIDLKYKEELILEQQKKLQEELDAKIRELTSNLMLISQKNNLLKSAGEKLKDALSKMNDTTKKDIKKLISSIDRQDIFDDNWEDIKVHFVKVNPEFFNTIKKHSPDISENDLKHCAYLKIGLSTKETAELLSVLPKTVEMARYRIKKKLKLKNQRLSDFIRNI